MMAHSVQIVIACDDPNRMMEFWSAALDYILQPPPDGFETWEQFADTVEIPADQRNDLGAVVDPEGIGPRLLFERWDGGVRNQRVHIDINSVGHGVKDEDRPHRLAAERERLELLGGTFNKEASGMAGESWIEMFDPEGNWFCVQ